MTLLTAPLTQTATVPSRVAFSCPSTASASGLLGEPNEVVTTGSPEPGDRTGPPRGRLLGGTGGPVVAKVADRQFAHLIHHDQDPGPVGWGR